MTESAQWGQFSEKVYLLGLGLKIWTLPYNLKVMFQIKKLHEQSTSQKKLWQCIIWKRIKKNCLKSKIQAPVFRRETQGAGSFRAGRSGNTLGNWSGQDNKNMFNLDHKRILQCQLGLEVDPKYFMVNLGVQ